jgi:hypothetical protein
MVSNISNNNNNNNNNNNTGGLLTTLRNQHVITAPLNIQNTEI